MAKLSTQLKTLFFSLNLPVDQIHVAALERGGRARERVLGAHVEHSRRGLGPEDAQGAASVPLGRFGSSGLGGCHGSLR